MPRLIRYVLTELAKVFFLALTVLTGLMLIVGVVDRAIREHVPPASLVWLIPYVLPFALTVSIPVTLLLATAVVYGRMSGSNEVLAIKALGISPMRIVWPALIAAFLLSLAAVWLNDLSFSWGRAGARRVVVEAAEEITYNMLRTQYHCTVSNLFVKIKGLDGRRLISPTLIIHGRGDASSITMVAKEAELRFDHQENVLRILAREGTIDIGGRYTVNFSVQDYEIPLPDAGQDSTPGNPSEMPLSRVSSQIVRQREVIAQYEQELAARAACQMICGEFDTLTGPEWGGCQGRLAGYRQNLCGLFMQPHRRWAAGFSCLCFVWVGVPMAIWLRNRDVVTIFFLCFAPILVVYYPAFTYGISGAKNGTIPPYSVWASNLILAAWGTYLLRKVIRY